MQILAKPSLFCYLNFLKLHSFIENILLKKKIQLKQKTPNLAGIIQTSYSFGKEIARFLARTVKLMKTKRLSEM